MKIGEIVLAELLRTEQYGLFLSCDKNQIFIQLPEIDWIEKIPSASGYAPLGTKFKVLMLAFNESKKLYYGSIKQAHPEEDPWEKICEFPIGSIHVARPLMNTEFGTFVELIPGLEALLYDQNGGSLEIGGAVKVSIKSYDLSRRRIEVEIPS